MAEIIRFDFNVSHDLTLRFDGGRETESQYGPQYMYSCTDGRIFYLDMNSSAVDQIQKLQIRRNIPFRICKTGRPRQVSWTVQRLDSLEQQLTESVAIANNGARPAGQPNAPTANVVPMPASTSTNNSPSQSTGLTLMSQALAGCLIAAMDAVHIAEQYAKAKGIPYEFAPEDTRALASTLYIQAAKSLPNFTTEPMGGAQKWQQ